MDNTINFISGGLLGDFIQQLYGIKNICEQQKAKANIYITDGYNGDTWRFGVQRAYEDLGPLITCQPYVNKFEILGSTPPESYINMNDWRKYAATTFSETGEYSVCWSEMLAKEFNFSIPTEYKWLTVTEKEPILKDKIIIHRSKHRHGCFNWAAFVSQLQEDVFFMTTDAEEFNLFKKSWFFENVNTDRVKLLLVNTVYDMAVTLNSCKYFIGNQSAPFSLANALDIPRLGELEGGVWKFYKDEVKYSNNISWFLGNEDKFYQHNAIVKL